jgi:predicted ATP-dependent endonuclease of OLD family
MSLWASIAINGITSIRLGIFLFIFAPSSVAFIEVLEKKHIAEEECFFPIVAAEEPEAHLHPNAQRTLYKQLTDIKGQTIISSHSPY